MMLTLKETKMSRLFKLTTVGEWGSIAPSNGEYLGELLARLAAEEMERCVAAPEEKVMYWGDRVAQLFHLAADAYEAGAAVTIGHNRTAMYEQAAERHRRMGDTLTSQALLFRKKAESEALLKHFDAGYAGEPVNQRSFERREAFALGQYYKTLGYDRPKELTYEYIDRVGHLKADGRLFLTEYPSGKIPEAIIKEVTPA